MSGTLTISGSPTFNGDSSCTIDSVGSDLVQPPSALLGAGRGWWAARVRVQSAITANLLARWDDAAITESYVLFVGGGTGGWTMRRRKASVNVDVTIAAAPAIGDIVTVIGYWDGTNIGVSVNGSAFSRIAATAAAPTDTLFAIGSNKTPASWFNGDFFWFAAGTGTLSDADAARIHAFGNTDKAPEDFIVAASSSACTMVWTADSSAYMDEVFTILDPDGTGASRGLLPRLRVEVDVTNDPTNATRVWTVITSRVRRLQSQRGGRNDELNRTETGTLHALLNNRGDVITSLGLRKGQWIRYRARWQNVEYARWMGLIEATPRKWPFAGKDAIIDLRATGQFKVFRLFDMEGQTFVSQRGDQRFAAIAALVGLTTATVDTDSDTLDAVSTPYSRDTDALSVLSDIEASENGLIIEEPDGRVSFQGRHWRMLHSATSRGTFGESAGQIPYRDTAELEDDDSRIANDVTAITSTGVVQNVSDVASINKYFRRRLNRTLLSSSATVALDAANYLLNRYKDPTPRIPTLEVALAAVAKKSTTLVATLLSAANSDRFTWSRAATTPISTDIYIEQIGETIEPGITWNMQFQSSPADDEAGWVLGDATLGILGTSTRLVY